MKIWLTTVGISPFAVINAIWTACKTGEYVPERIYLIVNKVVEEKGHVDTVKSWIDRILREYGVEPEIITKYAEETDFGEFAKILGGIVKKEKLEGNEVALDMTPGRKFMSALAMYLGTGSDVKYKADRVYYLHLADNSYQNQPYITIPLTKQKLYEMKNSLARE